MKPIGGPLRLKPVRFAFGCVQGAYDSTNVLLIGQPFYGFIGKGHERAKVVCQFTKECDARGRLIIVAHQERFYHQAGDFHGHAIPQPRRQVRVGQQRIVLSGRDLFQIDRLDRRLVDDDGSSAKIAQPLTLSGCQRHASAYQI